MKSMFCSIVATLLLIGGFAHADGFENTPGEFEITKDHNPKFEVQNYDYIGEVLVVKVGEEEFIQAECSFNEVIIAQEGKNDVNLGIGCEKLRTIWESAVENDVTLVLFMRKLLITTENMENPYSRVINKFTFR